MAQMWGVVLIIAAMTTAGAFYIANSGTPVPRRIVRDDGWREKMTVAMLSQVDSLLDLFRLSHGRYPENLRDLVVKPAYVNHSEWPAEGYLREYPTDAWGNALVYHFPGKLGKPYDLISLGSDGKEGGTNFERDLKY